MCMNGLVQRYRDYVLVTTQPPLKLRPYGGIEMDILLLLGPIINN